MKKITGSFLKPDLPKDSRSYWVTLLGKSTSPFNKFFRSSTLTLGLVISKASIRSLLILSATRLGKEPNTADQKSEFERGILGIVTFNGYFSLYLKCSLKIRL